MNPYSLTPALPTLQLVLDTIVGETAETLHFACIHAAFLSRNAKAGHST